jgi:hypothetical protein
MPDSNPVPPASSSDAPGDPSDDADSGPISEPRSSLHTPANAAPPPTTPSNTVLLLLLLLGGAVALLVGLLRSRPTRVIGPDPSTLPVPSASASASAAPFNQAAPTPRRETEPEPRAPEKP